MLEAAAQATCYQPHFAKIPLRSKKTAPCLMEIYQIWFSYCSRFLYNKQTPNDFFRHHGSWPGPSVLSLLVSHSLSLHDWLDDGHQTKRYLLQCGWRREKPSHDTAQCSLEVSYQNEAAWSVRQKWFERFLIQRVMYGYVELGKAPVVTIQTFKLVKSNTQKNHFSQLNYFLEKIGGQKTHMAGRREKKKKQILSSYTIKS